MTDAMEMARAPQAVPVPQVSVPKPSVPQAPALCRRRLRAELRLLREGAGLTGRQVAEATGWSVAKVSRLERAEGTLRESEVRTVCALYRVPEERTELLAGCAVRTRAPQWWHSREYRHLLLPGADDQLGLEAAASRIVLYDPESVPELLRTEEYSAAVAALPNVVGAVGVPSAGRVQALVAAGNRRRAVLDRPQDPPQLRVVVTEAVLYQSVGDREVLRGQLRRLTELSRRPGFELRVLPFSRAAVPAPGGPFALLGFADGSPSMVVREQLTAVDLLDDETSVNRYWAASRALLACAPGPAASLALVTAAADSITRRRPRGI